jgi:hypothetical protein
MMSRRCSARVSVGYSLKLWNDDSILSTSTVVASITGAAMLVATIRCSIVGGRLLIQHLKREAEIRVREASALFRDCPALRHCSQNSLATRAHASHLC